MSSVSVYNENDVAVVKLTQGVTNAINHALVKEMIEVFQQIRENTGAVAEKRLM